MSNQDGKNVVQEATEAVKAKMNEGKNVKHFKDKPSDKSKGTR